MLVKSAILNIPLELLLEVFRRLNYRDILKCGTVCRYFNKVINDSIEMQYIIELGADGMVDGARTNGTLPTANRLQLLLNRRARWRMLDWTDRFPVELDGNCHAYELVGGLFAKTMSHNNSTGAKHLTIIDLPTRTAEEQKHVCEDIGVHSRDFAIDPSQDLIAVVEIDDSEVPETVCIHLRTVSTNAKHKMAQEPVLRCQTLGRITSCFIQIVDDVIGLFFWLHNPALLIWNWHTGKLLVRCEGDPADEGLNPQQLPKRFPSLPPLTWDMAFLSNRAFLLNSISEQGLIHIYTFDDDGEPSVPPTCRITLAMPSLQPGRSVHHFATHSAPFLAGDRPNGKPFTTAEEARVYMMTITFGHERYHFFMKSEFVDSLIHKDISTPPNHEPRLYRWDEWGPNNTRFIESPGHYHWLRYVQGHRVVLPPTPVGLGSWPNVKHQICVLDFNVHPKRVNDPGDLCMRADKDVHYSVHTDDSRIAAKSLFLDDVVTRLPYAVSSRVGQFHYTGFMLDEERLVGIESSATSIDGDLNRVHVFTF